METDKKVFDVHVFVCTNLRDKPKESCGESNSMDLAHALKEEIKSRGLKNRIRINKSGCLDQCSKGPVIVIYPKDKWFYYVKPKDIPEILDEILKEL